MGCDKQDEGFDILNDEEIISNIIAVEGVDNDDDDSESEPNQSPIASHSEAEGMLMKYIDWFEN